MDGTCGDPYVARAMNLLLLFSALLSALTGAGIGVRRPEVAQAVAASAIQAETTTIAAAPLVRRPIVALPTLAASAAIGVAAAPILLRAADLWASRRRE